MKQKVFDYMSNFILGLVDLIFLPFLFTWIIVMHVSSLFTLRFDAYYEDERFMKIGKHINGTIAMWLLKLYINFLYDYDKKH